MRFVINLPSLLENCQLYNIIIEYKIKKNSLFKYRNLLPNNIIFNFSDYSQTHLIRMSRQKSEGKIEEKLTSTKLKSLASKIIHNFALQLIPINFLPFN